MHQGKFIDESGKEYVAQILPPEVLFVKVVCMDCPTEFEATYNRDRDKASSARFLKGALAEHQQSQEKVVRK